MSNTQEQPGSTLEFTIQLCHIEGSVFSPGNRVRFSTDLEARPGDKVVVFLHDAVSQEDGKIRVDHPENVLIRKLIYKTKGKVVLQSVIGADKESIPADHVKAIYPVCAVLFTA